MPEYDISYGNFDITPEVSTVRVFGFDERWALKAALDQLPVVSIDGEPAAWTVIEINEVVPPAPEPIPEPEPTPEQEAPDETA